MNANNTLGALAFGMGFIQMYNDFMNSDEVDEKSKNTMMLSVLVSSVWLIYQFRQDGPNFSVAYTAVGLFLQLYILNKVLIKESKKHRDLMWMDFVPFWKQILTFLPYPPS